MYVCAFVFFFFSSRRRHTRYWRDWSSDVCSSDLIAITMLMSIIFLAREMGLKFVDPRQLGQLRLPDGSPLPPGYDQHTVIAQIARAVFNHFDPGFYFVIAMTGVILVLAANTAFNGFPVLASILARDGYLPRQLSSR